MVAEYTYCNNGAPDSSSSVELSTTWSASGSYLEWSVVSGCSGDATYSDGTATYLTGGLSLCSETDSSTGESNDWTYTTYTWTLGADGTTATINGAGTDDVSLSDGEEFECNVTWSGTYTKE